MSTGVGASSSAACGRLPRASRSARSLSVLASARARQAPGRRPPRLDRCSPPARAAQAPGRRSALRLICGGPRPCGFAARLVRRRLLDRRAPRPSGSSSGLPRRRLLGLGLARAWAWGVFLGLRRSTLGRGALRSGAISKMWAIFGMRVARRAIVDRTSSCSSLGSDVGITLSRTGEKASASSTATQRSGGGVVGEGGAGAFGEAGGELGRQRCARLRAVAS